MADAASLVPLTATTTIDIRPYAGEAEIDAVMGLIDSELSEPYTVYTYRYFLNQWPELCFLAYASEEKEKEQRQRRRRNDDDDDEEERRQRRQHRRPVGVVIGKLERHTKGERLMRGYIGMVSVDPSRRGQGIATRLLHVTLREMVKRGAQEIVLETEVDNVASLRLYESLGFMREKRLFNFYLNGKDCFRMVLQLPSCVWQTPQPMHADAFSTSSSHQSHYAGRGHPSSPLQPLAFRPNDIL